LTAPASIIVQGLTLNELVDAVADAVAERIGTPKTGGSDNVRPSLVSTPVLAEQLSISRAKAHKLAEDGVIPFVWCGDVRRFDFDEVKAALKARGRVAK